MPPPPLVQEKVSRDNAEAMARTAIRESEYADFWYEGGEKMVVPPPVLMTPDPTRSERDPFRQTARVAWVFRFRKDLSIAEVWVDVETGGVRLL